MRTNYLRINFPDVENARNEVDYLFQVIRAIHFFFPKGHIELPAMCHHLYQKRASAVLDRLKGARVDIQTPIEMEWREDASPILMNKVIFPLCFIARCMDNLTIEMYNKAYQRFLTMKETVR